MLLTVTTHHPGHSLLLCFYPSKPFQLKIRFNLLMTLLRELKLFVSELLLLGSLDKQQYFRAPAGLTNTVVSVTIEDNDRKFIKYTLTI